MLKLQRWLADYWVVGAGFMAASLVAVAPVVPLPLPVFLIFLHSPVYMVHQVEEHTGDRFRKFANEHVFGGRDALTVASVLVINLPFVWGINLLALYAALLWGPAWGLVAPYVMIVNALAHLVTSARLRKYNPGLVTSALLFLPLSVVTIWTIGRTAGLLPHLIGAALAVLLHLAIIALVTARYRTLVASS
ncbi:HXXEE domain-containing protein [Mesorhizobium sp. M2A.F.Ca.ET.037.01.1.1]|uniref:HXXEE domain-containing protein n=1 Tax=unclassified Mesorhizobium TaxID=325217 RepID=UPI000FCA6AFD|nr:MULTISPECIES: HXXEE domain-containing protein [unclassified Mesorhizobium]RUY09033.1 HXXEE domain-containing protein [Mesorhizobium sp. M2A.F.Ca.ET.040.01.1.1]RVC67342.1 HXXEE domain-containing protein [Mesorhizobium sp. M00.F.Ca.ET.038.03.1.1]RUX04937.1 HXXEE domain-containing protein [Mesorhizobium sp. M2A.F.Ca.ET.037.01.1.1]RWA89662.1 MAG: HXXEE domain-containing protein [Mesorhizobium sp.]RWF04792.1 MAG: HXXEE domain-containing protein [Mesorhizobium sp.]